MATNKGRKNNKDQDSAANAEQPAPKAPPTEPKTEPATPKATSETPKSTPAAKETKPVIDAATAKPAATQSVEPKAAKPVEKPPEPTAKPAATQATQPPAPAQPKAEPVAAKPPQASFTPPTTPAKSVTAPPPASPVTKTVTTSQPSVTQPKVGLSVSDSSKVDFQGIKVKVVTFLENLPENTVSFFRQNQKPLISLGLILALLITLKITAGLLDILNEIPFVKPLFESIGVSYSGWFIYRYLLWSSTRKELWQKVDTAKADILGKTQ